MAHKMKKPQVGPIRSKRRLTVPKGNRVKPGGKIFGNPHNCSMPKPKS